jgi:ABC-2 type transport system permease protein
VTVTVIAALAAVLALVTTWLALLAFRDRPGVVLEAPDGDLGRVVLGSVLYLVTVTVLALAIGAALRRPAAATVVAITLLLVLEQALTMMGTAAAMTVRSVLPGWAGRLAATPTQSLTLAEQTAAQPGPWQGYGILVVWTVAVLLVAALVVRRRDV